MNWQAIGVICTVLIAIGGGLSLVISSLIKAYFRTLSDRMDGFDSRLETHTLSEERYQLTVTTLLTSMRESLIKLESVSDTYVTMPLHLDAMRTVDKSIVEVRHAMRSEVQLLLLNTGNDIRERLNKLEQKIDGSN